MSARASMLHVARTGAILSSMDRAACTTSDSRGSAATGNRDTSDLVPGQVGIRSDNMSHRIDYLIIFGST